MKLEKLVEKLNTKFIGDNGAKKVKVYRYQKENWADPYYAVRHTFETTIARFAIGGDETVTMNRFIVDGKVIEESVEEKTDIIPCLVILNDEGEFSSILTPDCCHDANSYTVKVNKKSAVIYDTTRVGLDYGEDLNVMEFLLV